MLVYLQGIETPEEQSKFTKMYKNYRGLLFHVAYKILENEQDAEDAVHQAFLKIAENMDKVGDPISPRTKSFIVTIVENRALDIYREKARHQQLPYNDEVIGLYVECACDCDITRCFAKLPARYREVLLLKHVHGFTNKEMAKILGIKEGCVIKLEQRAKSKLRDMVEKEGLL